MFYLRYCLTDTEILSLGLIQEYHPVDVSSALAFGQPFYERQVNMVGPSLLNHLTDVIELIKHAFSLGRLISTAFNFMWFCEEK